MTRAELEARLRRTDAALEVEGPRWPKVRARARRALRLRQIAGAAVVVAVFGAVVAGALLARAALDDDPARSRPAPERIAPPTGTTTTGTTTTGPEDRPPPPSTTDRPAAEPNLTGNAQSGELFVTNVGDGRAGSFRVTAGDALIAEFPGLGPGEPAAAELRPLPCPPGERTAKAKIDADQAVEESDEDDNIVSIPCQEAPG